MQQPIACWRQPDGTYRLVDDTAWARRLLHLLMFAGFVTGATLIWVEPRAPWWALALFGITGPVLTGVLFWHSLIRDETVRTRIDPATRSIQIEARSIRTRRRRTLAWAEIDRVDLREYADSDGAYYHLAIASPDHGAIDLIQGSSGAFMAAARLDLEQLLQVRRGGAETR